MGATPVPIEPIALPIPDAVRASGMSRTAVYRALQAGDLKAVKQGSRTLVLMASIRDYLGRLPAAQFGKQAA